MAHPYTEWEDYRAGMFNRSTHPDMHVGMAYRLLSQPQDLKMAMEAAVSGWPMAAEHNLTNVEQNRQAWLGAAACFYVGGSPEHTTRDAWWKLTPTQQRAANQVADEVTGAWEQARAGIQTLPFQISPTATDNRRNVA